MLFVKLKNNNSMKEEKFNSEEYYDDPEPKNYSSVVKNYSGKMPAPLLENLIKDLDWFILNISEGLMLPDEHYPTMDEIVDSMYNTGKYEFENERYKINAKLSLENESYEIIVNPEFFADEHYYSGGIALCIELLQEKSLSKISMSSVKKEITIKFQNILKAQPSVN